MTALHARPTHPVAPWAEVVPQMPLSSFGASNVGMRLAIRLGAYVEDNGLGAVTGEQGGYRLDLDHPLDTELAPNLAFVRADRLPATASPEYYKRAPPGTPWVSPDLAVEVASDNTPRGYPAPGMATKAKIYLTFGTRLIWVIWPRYRRVDVWHNTHGVPDAVPVALGIGDTLDGEDVVPGFTFPVARLFP